MLTIILFVFITLCLCLLSKSTVDQRGLDQLNHWPLKVFFDYTVDVTSWSTILDSLQRNLHYAYIAYERNDDAPIVALSYHWDTFANLYADSEDWDSGLSQLQSSHSYELRDHPHVNRLKEHVVVYKKMWVDQHCFPHSRKGSLTTFAKVYRGYVFGSWLTKHSVDHAFATNTAMDLLGSLEQWLGRGWVLQEVTSCGYLVNFSAFEYFLEKSMQYNDARLISGATSLCLLLNRMKGRRKEPLEERILRFYDVDEASFSFESDREINLPDFSDVGYVAFPVGAQPEGYVLQPEIRVEGDRMSMMDSHGNRISKWFKYKALYCKGYEIKESRVCVT